MFSVTIAYVNQQERERAIEEGLRRRQVLAQPGASIAPTEPTRSTPAERRAPLRARGANR